MDKKWHILRVRSGREVAVASELRVPAYVPHIVTRRFDRRRRVNITRRTPMLPTYVFLLTDDPRSAQFSLRPGLGHLGFMRNGDRSFAVLSHRAFEALRSVEENFVLPELPSQWQPSIGDIVTTIKPVVGEIKVLVEEIKGNTVLGTVVGTYYRASALVRETTPVSLVAA